MENVSDEQLMETFSKGDHPAFAELYQRHKGALYRYFVRQLGSQNRGRAEELFQDVWHRVVDKQESYTPTAKFTTWLYHIAHNLLIDEHRKRLSENAHLQQVEEESSTSPSEENLSQRDNAAIRACLERLAPLQREAFLLKHDSGFSAAQIGEIVDAKPEAIKTRLRYAMQQLRECLTQKLGGRQ